MHHHLFPRALRRVGLDLGQSAFHRLQARLGRQRAEYNHRLHRRPFDRSLPVITEPVDILERPLRRAPLHIAQGTLPHGWNRIPQGHGNQGLGLGLWELSCHLQRGDAQVVIATQEHLGEEASKVRRPAVRNAFQRRQNKIGRDLLQTREEERHRWPAHRHQRRQGLLLGAFGPLMQVFQSGAQLCRLRPLRQGIAIE